MKKGAIIGLILSAAIAVCSCSGGEEPKRQIKQEIVIACGKDATGTFESVMTDFTGQSETTRVKLIEFSNESVELHRAVSSMLAGKEVQLDGMLIEDVWIGEFVKNGYLKPLDDMVEFDAASYHPSIAEFAQKDGALYWYPMILDTGVMFYREDLSDGTLNYGQLAEQSDISYSVQGADGEEMLCCAFEFINLTGSVSDGIKLYKKVIESSVTSGDNYIAGFKNGDAAYARAWSRDSKEITAYSQVSAYVNTSVLKKDNGESYATARAYGLAMNAASDKTENMKELLGYLSTADVQTRILRDTRTLPLRRADYENPSISYYASYIEETLPMFETLKFRPNRDNYTYLSRQAREALNEYITAGGSLENAAEAIGQLLATE